MNLKIFMLRKIRGKRILKESKNSRKCKLIYNDINQNSGCDLSMKWGVGEERITKEYEKTLTDDEYVHQLDCGKDSLLYTHVKIYQTVHFRYVYIVFYYISIKLFLKNKNIKKETFSMVFLVIICFHQPFTLIWNNCFISFHKMSLFK